MGLEDEHLGTLRSIEYPIYEFYKDGMGIEDQQAIKVLETLQTRYRALASGREVSDVENLNELEERLYKEVVESIEDSRATPRNPDAKPQRRAFTRSRRELTEDDIILACLRKITKSAKRHHKLQGATGYLDFISEYIQ